MKQAKLTIGYLENINRMDLNDEIDNKLSDKYMISLLRKRGLKIKIVKKNDVKDSKLPFIFIGFNTPWKIYLYKSFTKWLKVWEKNTNLSASMDMLKYIANKCKYLSDLKKNRISIIRTKCYKLSNLDTKKLYKMKHKFLKPNPGAWGGTSLILKNTTNKSVINQFIHKLKHGYVNNLIVQPWLKNFAANHNPELRTFFYRKDGKHYFHHAVKTTGTGVLKSIVKNIPKKLEKDCIRIGKIMEKKFGVIFYYRCDWTKHNNRMLLNELEFFPGINYGENLILAKDYFNLIADEIVKVAKNKS